MVEPNGLTDDLGREAVAVVAGGEGSSSANSASEGLNLTMPQKGAIVPQHSHDNEQLTYVLEGKLRFWIGEDGSEVVDVGPGEVLHLPSNVPHKAEALEETLDVDIFTPPRRDWLEGTDTYFKDQ